MIDKFKRISSEKVENNLTKNVDRSIQFNLYMHIFLLKTQRLCLDKFALINKVISQTKYSRFQKYKYNIYSSKSFSFRNQSIFSATIYTIKFELKTLELKSLQLHFQINIKMLKLIIGSSPYGQILTQSFNSKRKSLRHSLSIFIVNLE